MESAFSKCIKSLSITAFGLLFYAYGAQANIGDHFGHGIRSSAMGGTGVTGHSDGYDVLMNPGLMSSRRSGDRLRLSAGFLFFQPQFKSINNVVLVNDITGDFSLGQSRRGDVNHDYRDTVGTLLGISAILEPDWWNWAIGVSAFFPMNHLAYIDSGENFVPEYVLYRSRTQRPQIEFGTSIAPFKNWSFGLGARMAYSLTTKAEVFLQGDSARSSSMRFSTTMRPRFVPEVGVVYTSDDRRTGVGLVVRAPARSPSVLNLDSSARVLGDLARLNFGYTSNSVIYYDPMTIELGGHFMLFKNLKTSLQIDYQRWSGFESPMLSVEVGKTQGVAIGNSILPAFQYKDVVVPRIGMEWDLGRSNQGKIRWGYYYRDSMIKGKQSGSGNYLDPARHHVGLGYSFFWPHFLGLNHGASIDFSGIFQHLVGYQVQKASGNELSQGSGDLKVGAPGYPVGGFVWGLGTGMTVEF